MWASGLPLGDTTVQERSYRPLDATVKEGYIDQRLRPSSSHNPSWGSAHRRLSTSSEHIPEGREGIPQLLSYRFSTQYAVPTSSTNGMGRSKNGTQSGEAVQV